MVVYLEKLRMLAAHFKKGSVFIIGHTGAAWQGTPNFTVAARSPVGYSCKIESIRTKKTRKLQTKLVTCRCLHEMFYNNLQLLSLYGNPNNVKLVHK
jgi:hypothetical protein